MRNFKMMKEREKKKRYLERVKETKTKDEESAKKI